METLFFKTIDLKKSCNKLSIFNKKFWKDTFPELKTYFKMLQ